MGEEIKTVVFIFVLYVVHVTTGGLRSSHTAIKKSLIIVVWYIILNKKFI